MPDYKGKYCWQTLDASNVDALAQRVSSFYREAGGEWRSPRYWRWYCGENPAGGSACIVALRNGRVVGMLGDTYMRFCVAGRQVRAALLGELRVLESERSWRCCIGLMEQSVARAVADQVAMGYAFTVRSAVELSHRLGAVRLGRIPVYGGFVNVPRLLQGRGVPPVPSLAGWLAQPLLGTREGSRRAGDLDIRLLEGPFDRSFDELWGAVGGRRTVAAVRDAAYLNWRYVQCPDRRYRRLAAFRAGKPQGLAVFRSKPKRRTGYLLELFARNDCATTLRALLERAVASLAEEGVGLVTGSFPAASAEAAMLAEMGFQRWVTGLWNMHLVVVSDPAPGPRPQLDASNWYFSLGDWLTQ